MKPTPLYEIDPGLCSRSVSFENPRGAPGAGGRASSPLGQGRKGSAVRHVHDGESVVLADIEGNGTLRHVWLTTHDKPHLLRGTAVRIYWDEQTHPSVELPLSEFFGFAHGRSRAFQTCLHSVGSTRGMNCWIPMPFTRRARVELHNASGARLPLFYQIDYTLGDGHPEDVGRLHASFRRENPTTPARDLELMSERNGAIRYLGAVIGVRPLEQLWWGEGEMKVYLDDDDAFPTIAGTGSEDYVGQAFGIQEEAFRYHGCNYREKNHDADTGRVSIYRWHVRDPIVCRERMRVTIAQIGHRPTGRARTIDDYKAELYERADDWSVAAFWYERAPSAPLPGVLDPTLCLADLEPV